MSSLSLRIMAIVGVVLTSVFFLWRLGHLLDYEQKKMMDTAIRIDGREEQQHDDALTIIKSPPPELEDANTNNIAADPTMYASQPASCNAGFLYAKFWCDENVGNGMHQLPQVLALGYVLNRTVLIALHRRSKCDGIFMEFNPKAHVLAVEDNPITYVRNRRIPGCNADVDITRYRWTPSITNFGFECDDLNRFRSFTIVELGKWVQDLTTLVHNKHLTWQERARATALFRMGRYSYGGLLMQQFVDISTVVKREFLDLVHGEYAPGSTMMNLLKDPKIYKIGLQVRHLPFIVHETGAAAMDKRAVQCVSNSLQVGDNEDVSKTPTSGFTQCLVIVATDTKESRESLPSTIRTTMKLPSSFSNPCEVMFITASSSSSSRNRNTSIPSPWGGSSTNDGESRSRADRRGVLEAYLDWFVLSEFSHQVVVGLGSTFAHLVATRSAAKVDVVWEYASFSCKDGGYFPYPCCMARRKGADMYVSYSRGAGDAGWCGG